MKKIRVLVVDDSAIVRQTLCEVLASDPEIEVMATASDPFVAVRHMKEERPDVVLLDVEMPRMDGLSFLDRIMSQHPLPVIICSTLTERGSASALAALERGAVEVISKPKIGTRQFLEESQAMIAHAVKAAVQAKARPSLAAAGAVAAPKLSADVMVAKRAPGAMVETTDRVVAVGASTGGTEALRVFLSGLTTDGPGVVVVQHMPPLFTAHFARRLDSLCAIRVKEAEHGESVLRGHALIAPGGKHLLLKRSGARYYVEVKDGPLVNRHRPSVDVLFRSTARYAGQNSIGVLLTGMGDDGARGLKEMKEAGAHTLAQDEATSVVYGMPREAMKLGAVDRQLPIDRIAHDVLRACAGR